MNVPKVTQLLIQNQMTTHSPPIPAMPLQALMHLCLGSRCVSSNIVLLTQAFRKKFVIPDFEEFTSHVDRIFEDAKELTGGKVRARGIRGRGEGSGPDTYYFSETSWGWGFNDRG